MSNVVVRNQNDVCPSTGLLTGHAAYTRRGGDTKTMLKIQMCWRTQRNVRTHCKAIPDSGKMQMGLCWMAQDETR